MTPEPVSIAEGNRRLLILADYLDTVPPECFDFALVKHGPDDITNGPVWGTVGCAMGYAPAALPGMIAFVRPAAYETFIFVVPGSDRLMQYPEAAAHIFGMDRLEANDLFSPDRLGRGVDRYATPKQVSRRLRRYVAQSAKYSPPPA